jgi:glycosyltransferase involved in cell wall biosynthesis
LQKRIWITWENQRRSIELARKFNCVLYIFEYEGFLRYPKCIINTLLLLRKMKPKILFVQNPSMILAALACSYKIFFGTVLIVDRHSNFLLNDPKPNFVYTILFELLNRFTLRTADITIITNSFLSQLVKGFGGNPHILPDKLPTLINSRSLKLIGRHNVLLISSFGLDEPIEESINAMRNLISCGVYLYITGNYKRLNRQIVNLKPDNIIFTGFLSDQDFVDMIFSVNAVMVLTKIDHCMLCGCYEAVSAQKPLITSRKKVLVEYFTGAIFVDNTSEGILNAIKQVIANPRIYQNKIKNLKSKLEIEWKKQCIDLEKAITKLPMR